MRNQMQMKFRGAAGSLDRRPLTSSTVVRVLATVSTLTLATVPIRADCLPSSAPAGDLVPFVMSTHSNKGIVSAAPYVDAAISDTAISGALAVSYTFVLRPSIGYHEYVFLSGDKFGQLFSDRTFCADNQTGIFCGDVQPFSVKAPAVDKVGLSISEDLTDSSHPIGVTITLDSWGNSRLSFQAHCDTSTGLLYGSIAGEEMVVISFGTPYKPQPPPK